MSYDSQVYIGWYLECQPAATEYFKYSVKCLYDNGHNISANDNFCKTCGSKTGKVGVPTLTFKYFRQIEQKYTHLESEITEALHETRKSGGIEYLVSNHRGHGKHLDGKHDTAVVTLFTTAEDMQKLLDNTLFTPELIAEIKEAVGYESIELKYGVLVWQS